jgi:MFS family permease
MPGTTTPNRWVQLSVAMLANVAGTIYVSAAPFLIPHLREQGLSLVEAGFVASAPTVGMLLTLFLWGAIVDAIGERLSLTIGLGMLACGALAASFTSSPAGLAAALLVGGIGGASTNSASGRVVVGWFPAHQRGKAMGIRQTAQPLGVGIAALAVPLLVHAYGTGPTFAVLAAICAASAACTWAMIVDPARPARSREASRAHNPYRDDGRLARIHAASVLLVIPQFTVWTFTFVWLVDEKNWAPLHASLLVASTQLLGAAARIGAGAWSDRVGSRLRPMRTVAAAAAVVMVALGVFEASPVAYVLVVAASAITVADNGLAFTAVAEIGGPFWAGRAMGIQNTGQFLAAAATPPALGALITASGYGWAFAAVAVFPLLAVPMIPTGSIPTKDGESS